MWTKRDDRLAVKYHGQGMYTDEIAELLGRSERDVITRLRKLGAKLPPNPALAAPGPEHRSGARARAGLGEDPCKCADDQQPTPLLHQRIRQLEAEVCHLKTLDRERAPYVEDIEGKALEALRAAREAKEALQFARRELADLKSQMADFRSQNARLQEDLATAIGERDELGAAVARLTSSTGRSDARPLHEAVDAALNLPDHNLTPWPVDPHTLRPVLARIALALACDDALRAHRAIGDAVASRQVALDQITEATLLVETDLLDERLRNCLESIGIVTCGDLVETSEPSLRILGAADRSHTLGERSWSIVLEVRSQMRFALERSVQAAAR